MSATRCLLCLRPLCIDRHREREREGGREGGREAAPSASQAGPVCKRPSTVFVPANLAAVTPSTSFHPLCRHPRDNPPPLSTSLLFSLFFFFLLFFAIAPESWLSLTRIVESTISWAGRNKIPEPWLPAELVNYRGPIIESVRVQLKPSSKTFFVYARSEG